MNVHSVDRSSLVSVVGFDRKDSGLEEEKTSLESQRFAGRYDDRLEEIKLDRAFSLVRLSSAASSSEIKDASTTVLAPSQFETLSDQKQECEQKVSDFRSLLNRLTKKSERSLSFKSRASRERQYAKKLLAQLKACYKVSFQPMAQLREEAIRLLCPSDDVVKILDRDHLEQLKSVINELAERNAQLSTLVTQGETYQQTQLTHPVRAEKTKRDLAFYREATVINQAHCEKAIAHLNQMLSPEVSESLSRFTKEGTSLYNELMAMTHGVTHYNPVDSELISRHYGKGMHRVSVLNDEGMRLAKQWTDLSLADVKRLRAQRGGAEQYLTGIRDAVNTQLNRRVSEAPSMMTMIAQSEHGKEYEVNEAFYKSEALLADDQNLILSEHTLSTFPDSVKLVNFLKQTRSIAPLTAVHADLINSMKWVYDCNGIGLFEARPDELRKHLASRNDIVLFPGGTPAANVLSGDMEGVKKGLVIANRSLRSIWYAMKEGLTEVTLCSVNDALFPQRKSWGRMDGLRRYLIRKNIPGTYLRASGENGSLTAAYKRVRREGANYEPLKHHHLFNRYELGKISNDVRAIMPDEPRVLQCILHLLNPVEFPMRRVNERLFTGLCDYFKRQFPEMTLTEESALTPKSIEQCYKQGALASLLPTELTEHKDELTNLYYRYEQHRLQIPGFMVLLHTLIHHPDHALELTDD